MQQTLQHKTETEKMNRQVKRKKRLVSLIKYLILIAGALIMLYPILWLFGASFKTNSEIFQSI